MTWNKAPPLLSFLTKIFLGYMGIPPLEIRGVYHLVLKKIWGVAGTDDSRFCGVSQVYVEAKKLTL